MLRKLRLKFVAICMTLVAVILAAVFLSSFLSIRQNIAELSRQLLYRVIQQEGAPYRPEIGLSLDDGQTVLLPYFTVRLVPLGGTYHAYVTGGTYSDLDDTEALAAILHACLEQEGEEGVLPAYRLRYLRQAAPAGGQRIAFVDISLERAMLRQTLGSHLMIMLAALLVFLAVSTLLARWATAPVERAWQRQRQFLSDASHELKTPLTVILSNAALLEGAGLAEKPARWAGSIQAEGLRMKRLVEEMLTLARGEAAPPPGTMEEVALSDLLEDCVLAFEPVAFEAGKPLEYDIAPGITVQGDGARLRQLAGVLLDNAIKYGAEGKPIRLRLTAQERRCQLAVMNQGEPIPEEERKKLFQRFYRADASRGETSGFGLGLAIAQQIVEAHRGSIRVESDLSGTRFLCLLPCRRGG